MPSIIELRPASTDDLSFLYDLAMRAGPKWDRMYRFGLPNPLNFQARLEYDCLMQFVAECDGAPVGAAALFEYSETSATAWVDVVSDEGSICSAIASAVLEQGFLNWQLRKIYLSTNSNEAPVLSVSSPDLHHEGTLKASVYSGGLYLDYHIHAAYNESWVRAQ